MLNMKFEITTEDRSDLRLRVNAEFIMLLARFVSKNPEHGELQYIQALPHKDGGVLLCALDGSKAGVFYDKRGVCGVETLMEVRPDIIKHCKAGVSEHGRWLEIDAEGRASVRDHIGAPLHIEPQPVTAEGDFPDWLSIYEKALESAGNKKKKPLPVLPMDLSPFYLTTRSECRALTFHPSSEATGPVVVRHGSYREFVGLIMPVEAEADTCLYDLTPEWLRGPEVVIEQDNPGEMKTLAADEDSEKIASQGGAVESQARQ